jgi:exopolyphosphatase / guanosine-5'-triphosphate,3'-diphosphate pyrophosphatase
MKIAVVDLGTNTFNTLIAEKIDNQSFKDIYRERIHVNLASEGITKIGDAPFQRGLDAMRFFAEKIKEQNVAKIRAVGTAALRTATNGLDFVEKVKNETGILIEIIDGDEEARLIFEGVRLAYPFGDENELIIDVGGGSVEFIIANKNGFLWEQSFPIGVAVLRNHFHQEEPIRVEDITAIYTYFDTILAPLFEVLKKYPVRQLVGSSGTFDVLESIFVLDKKHLLHSFISIKDSNDFYESIKFKTLEERFTMSNVPPSRAVMIVVAMVLIQYVIEKCNIEQIVTSSYAMKEGILIRLLSDE